MTLIEIRNAITKVLRSHFPDSKTCKILYDDVRESPKTHTFIVDVRPVKTDNYRNYKQRVVNVTISYTNDPFINSDVLMITEQLENAFNFYLDVDADNKPAISNLTFARPDELLTCNFTLEYVEDSLTPPRKQDPSTTAGELVVGVDFKE